MLLIILLIPTIVSSNSINELKAWNFVYHCDEKFVPICSTPLIQTRFTIGQFVNFENDVYTHFIVTLFDRVRVIRVQTKFLCRLDINFSKFIDKQIQDSINLVFGNKACDILGESDQLVFEAINELEKNAVVNSYPLDTPKSLLFSNGSHFSVDLMYWDGIFLSLKHYSSDEKQDTFPFYLLGPSKILISLIIKDLTIRSRYTYFTMDIHISSTRIEGLGVHISVYPYDLNNFGVFKSYEISNGPNGTNRATKKDLMSLFWRDVAYTSTSRRRSSSILANLQLFNHTNLSYEPIFNKTFLRSKYYTRIDFVAINTENCFYKKKLLIWDATFGRVGEPDPQISLTIGISLIVIYAVIIVHLIIIGVVISLRACRRRSNYQLINQEESETG